MSVLHKEIIDFGQQRNFTEIYNLLKNSTEEELITNVKQRITSPNFTELWNFILTSFKETEQCHEKRTALSLCVLNQLEEKDIPTSRINAIINRLSLELPKFRSNDLAKLCGFCLERIQSQKTVKMGWKELLPEVLNVLVERETVTVDDLDYSGMEYKTNLISTLCMTNWSPSTVTNLVSIFIDMPLSKDEHQRIVNKLATYMEKLIPQEIPSFVYQLLRLCKAQHGKVIFFKLQTYFNTKIYDNANDNENSPELLDLIESTSNQEAIDAEGTVLFHIHDAASLGYECIKDFLNVTKNLTKAPEVVLNPFMLMALFTISTIPHYEETVFDIIRTCIVRWYNEEKRKKNSAWFREMIPTTKRPEAIFQQLVQYSLQDRELVLPALVNFGFLLLGIGSALGRDPIAEKQWTLGTMMLLKITKRKQMIAHTVLQTLSNCIVTRQSNSQYIECLYVMSKNYPLLMLENQSCIVELMENLVQIPGQIANHLLDALMGLTKVSQTLRDHLILLLRKALYARPIGTRLMAVNGFLKLITKLKISNLAALSQSSMSTGSFSSGHSLYTQISMSRSTQSFGASNFSNEAICLEVLGVLKRCFMQQAEVRAMFYEGLYKSVCFNMELAIPVLDLIWFHFCQYYVMDEQQEMPLDFKKISQVKDADCVLHEPLGKLIYIIGLITIKASEFEDGKENNTVIKFTNILDSLCDRMKNCELVHFELNDGTDLLDVVPESQMKMHVLKEAMNIYEALMGYKISSWNEQSEDHGRVIYSLYQGYRRLLHFAKTLSNPKKGDGKKKKASRGGQNKSTQQTQPNNDTLLKKETGKISFKLPDTLLEFETVTKILHLLHDTEVSWTTNAQANVLKSKQEFHQHIMQSTIHLVQITKRRKDLDANVKKTYFDYLTDVAGVLFQRIVKRLVEFVEFDCITGILAMECFHAIINVVISNFSSNFDSFLEKIIGESDFISNLTVLMKIYQKLFETDEEEASSELDIKKLPLIVINTMQTLSNRIPVGSNPLAVQFFDWLKNFTQNNTVPSKIAMPFIHLLFEIHVRYKITLTILEHMTVCVGDIIGVITEEEHSSENLKIVNEATLNPIVLSLCNNTKTILEDIDAVIIRLKSEFNLLACPGVENLESKLENLKITERGTCYHACLVISILTNLNNLLVTPGNLSEAIFKSTMMLFSSLTSLTKHFTSRCSKTNLAFEAARFERVVKLAGKQLAPAVYKFILHIEESQKQDTQPTQSKKKVDSSALKSRVLRETRLIPKVVYEMEQFGKCIIQLSNKTKVDLSKYVGQGVARDFRIKELRAVLEEAGELRECTQDTSLDDTLNSSAGSSTSQSRNKTSETTEDVVEDEEEAEVILNSDDDEPGPPSKKTRTR